MSACQIKIGKHGKFLQERSSAGNFERFSGTIGSSFTVADNMAR
jgi:hypothetical protein